MNMNWNSIKEKIKEYGPIVLGLIAITLFFGIFSIFIKYLLIIALYLVPIFEKMNNAISFIVLLLLACSVVPAFRVVTGVGIIIGASLWGIGLWLNSLIITYTLWGLTGIFIGLFLAGVGVLPSAILALLFNGEWRTALILLVSLIITLAAHLLGYWVISKSKYGDK